MFFRKNFFLLAAVCVLLSSCSRLGWGVLLWTIEEPPIPSGTVLPVYIRSNIDHVWVVGVPENFRKEKKAVNKIEIPMAQLEFSGRKQKAVKWAENFAQFAPLYAENLQDGLPIREDADNNARRVYRLRVGEIIKILNQKDGNPAISANGDPLPGEWYQVLTHNGVIGYCFSYRLKIFDHYEGPLLAAPAQKETALRPDPELDMVMTKTWSPESYLQMVNARQVNIAELEKNWRFDPGQDTGIAKIIMPELEKDFVYEGVYPDGERAWRFEGTNLMMNLRSNTTLAVQYTENSGARRTLLFVALSADVDDLIMQENVRREGQYNAVYSQGPMFTSNNYGTITLSQTGEFEWTGFDLLVPQLISPDTPGKGRVYMDLFLTPSFEERFNGACTFRFDGAPAGKDQVRFLYSVDNQGLRFEVVPDFAVEDVTVTRRSTSPMVLYFFRETF
jgi:hypothetical protein